MAFSNGCRRQCYRSHKPQQYEAGRLTRIGKTLTHDAGRGWLVLTPPGKGGPFPPQALRAPVRPYPRHQPEGPGPAAQTLPRPRAQRQTPATHTGRDHQGVYRLSLGHRPEHPGPGLTGTSIRLYEISETAAKDEPLAYVGTDIRSQREASPHRTRSGGSQSANESMTTIGSDCRLRRHAQAPHLGRSAQARQHHHARENQLRS